MEMKPLQLCCYRKTSLKASPLVRKRMEGVETLYQRIFCKWPKKRVGALDTYIVHWKYFVSKEILPEAHESAKQISTPYYYVPR